MFPLSRLSLNEPNKWIMVSRGFDSILTASAWFCYTKLPPNWATGDSWRQSADWVRMWVENIRLWECGLYVERASTGPRCEVLVICVILFLKTQFGVKSVHTWLSRFYHWRRCFDSFQLNPVLGLVENNIEVIHILSELYETYFLPGKWNYLVV